MSNTTETDEIKELMEQFIAMAQLIEKSNAESTALLADKIDEFIKFKEKEQADWKGSKQQIKDSLTQYQKKAYEEEIIQLRSISETLQNNINNTFASIDAALKQTVKKLSDSYKSFFEMCEKFNASYSVAIDSKQIAEAVAVLLQESKGTPSGK